MDNRDKRKPKTTVKLNIHLNDEQRLAKELILNNPITLLRGQTGSGKAQPMDSLVLTPKGYVQMKDLKVGDIVCTPDGGIAPILGIFPQGKKDIVEVIFNDGTSTKCCTDHLWNVLSRTRKHFYKIRRNKYRNLTFNQYQTLSVNQLQESSLQNAAGHNKWFVPITKPVHFVSEKISIDPYILGCLLGDGHLGHNQLTLTSSDIEIVQKFEHYCNEVGMKLTNTGFNNGYDYRLTKANTAERGKSYLQTALSDIGLLGTLSQTKFIPIQYKLQTPENRLSLLQGLLDTDGGLESKCITFNTTSRQLANDVQFIVQSLGGIARITSRKAKLRGIETGSVTYRVGITLPYEYRHRAFRLTRKLCKIPRNKKEPNRSISMIKHLGQDECQCIYIGHPDHLYITDQMIVTHNTLAACAIALDLFFKREIEKIVITRPVVAAADEIGFLPGTMQDKMLPWLMPIYSNLYQLYNKEFIDKMIGEGHIEILPMAFVRGRTLVDAFIIVDECQNITHQQTEMLIGRLGLRSTMVFCGDTMQIDLKSKKESGINFFKILESRVPGVKVITLLENHRHAIVPQILDIYKEHNINT